MPVNNSEGNLILDENGNPQYTTIKKDWMFYYFITDPLTKKKTQKYKGGFKTKREAVEALNQIQSKMSRKDYNYGTSITLGEYLLSWLEEYVPSKGLSPCTIRGYHVNVNKHIIPYIGNLILPEVDCRTLDKLYERLYQEGLSKSSIRYVKYTLVAAFKEALKDKLVTTNEAVLSDLPSVIPDSDFEYNTLTPEQIIELLSLTKDTYLEVAIGLAGILGLRRGEVLGLRYKDIDFEHNKINLRSQFLFEKKQIIERGLKAGSKRIIIMPQLIIDILIRNKERQDQLKDMLGPEYEENDIVVTNDKGNMISPSILSKSFKKLLKDNGFPDMRFHDLRHSANSNMYTIGVGKEERKAITGHKTDKMDELYMHLHDNSLRTAAEAINNVYMEFKKKD